jgi:hypothetical protein
MSRAEEQACSSGRYWSMSIISSSGCCLRCVFTSVVFTIVLLYSLTFRTGASRKYGSHLPCRRRINGIIMGNSRYSICPVISPNEVRCQWLHCTSTAGFRHSGFHHSGLSRTPSIWVAKIMDASLYWAAGRKKLDRVPAHMSVMISPSRGCC